MPTVLRQDGFEFVIYTNDHEPMHVHAYKGDGEAKIELSPVAQDYLIQKWREIHG